MTTLGCQKTPIPSATPQKRDAGLMHVKCVHSSIKALHHPIVIHLVPSNRYRY